MSEYETVNVHREGAAATIELNRPETLNAWNAQLGHDLLAAVDARSPRTTACAPCASPAPGRALLRRRRPARPVGREDRTPDGHPDVRRVADRALPPDHHDDPRRCPSRCSRRSTARRSASGCSLALACDLVVAAESAYFLLAFVNIGLVPDGGSSLFVPDARRVRARDRDGDARRARSAPRRRSTGAWSTASCPTTPSPARSTALRDRLAAGPTRSYAGHQAPAQRTGSTRAWRSSSSSRPTSSRRWRARADFAEGVAAFIAEAPARVRRAGESRHLRAVVRRAVNTILAALARTPCHPPVASPRLRRSLVALAALLAFAGAAFADALTPESGRLAERRRDRLALQARPRRRARRSSSASRARCSTRWSSSARARAPSPPRSAATRAWRSAGRSAPR